MNLWYLWHTNTLCFRNTFKRDWKTHGHTHTRTQEYIRQTKGNSPGNMWFFVRSMLACMYTECAYIMGRFWARWSHRVAEETGKEGTDVRRTPAKRRISVLTSNTYAHSLPLSAHTHIDGRSVDSCLLAYPSLPPLCVLHCQCSSGRFCCIAVHIGTSLEGLPRFPKLSPSKILPKRKTEPKLAKRRRQKGCECKNVCSCRENLCAHPVIKILEHTNDCTCV